MHRQQEIIDPALHSLDADSSSVASLSDGGESVRNQDIQAGVRMRPVLAKDIRNLNQLVIKASEPDSQASALPPLLEPQ